MCVTSETDEKMTPDNDIDSPAAADDTSSVGSVGGNGELKKGPWTSAEDVILVGYVNEHGEGNWNAVQKRTGLARSGKSCRLRWANHLRPDLKKGAFTPDEEHIVLSLHAKIGNRWARMATELPGRTDNEIKNYWNTRTKRRLRLGLPIYPPEIVLQALDENQQISSGDVPANDFEIPLIQFKRLDYNQHLYPLPLPGGSFLDISTSDLLLHGLHSSYPNNSLLSTMHPSKRLQGSESISNATMSNIIPSGSQYQSGSYVQNAQPFIYSSPCDRPVHASRDAILIGNPSSEPTGAMNQELPSLQTQADNWGSPSSPMPPLESADTLIQTPPTELCPLSSQNSDLLDAVLHESQTEKNLRNSSNLQLSSHASDMDTNLTDDWSQLMHEMGWEWGPYEELTSPLPMFSEPEAGTGLGVKDGEAILDPTEYNKITNQMFSTLDSLLDSDRFGPLKES